MGSQTELEPTGDRTESNMNWVNIVYKPNRTNVTTAFRFDLSARFSWSICYHLRAS